MNKYLRAAYIVLRNMKEYTLDFIGQIIYFPVKFIILFFVWNFVYKNAVNGMTYTFEEMIGYYFILSIVETSIMPTGTVTYLEWDAISSGDMNMFFTKPICYPIFSYAQKLSEFLIKGFIGAFFILLTKVIMSVIFHIDINLENWDWFVISMFLGFTIMINLFQIIGHITFWVENVLSLRDNLWNIIRIFSGEIFPITLYPLFLQNICNVMPFQYIYYAPISILQGKVNQGLFTRFMIIQSIWALGLTLLNGFIWRKGNTRYVSQGG